MSRTPLLSVIGIVAACSLAVVGSAAAGAYKTADGAVVVTGLQPRQHYQIRMLDAQNKPGSRQGKLATACGDIVVDKAANYKVLVVGAESVEPSALPVKAYDKCPSPVPAEAKRQPKGVVTAKTPEPR